jgi:transmembrane sensor
MADLERKIADAREHLERPWQDERVDRAAGALEGRRRRRAARRTTLTTLAVVVAAAFGWRFFAPPSGIAIAPGVTAQLVDGGQLRPLAIDDGNASVELVHGGARFTVLAKDDRTLRVQAGDVVLVLRSGRFLVASSSSELHLSVAQGELQVLFNGGTRTIAAGQWASFPLRAPPPPKSSAPLPPTEPAPTAAPPVPATARVAAPAKAVAAPRPSRSWRAAAEQGDFDKAYEELSRSGPQAVRDVPAELLLAADVARLSHHPADAVAPLERVVRDHARDPRAPLAAFTLGRVLLDELGRPQPAAAAFATARSLASDGPLAPDALAREVEAWSRAGDMLHARQRADEYLQRYPKGARINSVRRFGGLE